MKSHHIIAILAGVAAIAIVYKYINENNGTVSSQADSLGYSKSSRAQRYSNTK